MFQLRSGRLQRETVLEAFDLVKEISQTCGRSATVRPKNGDRREALLLRLVLNPAEKE